MAYFNNAPLNNKSGLGGKEKMQREEAKGKAREAEECTRDRVAKDSFEGDEKHA